MIDGESHLDELLSRLDAPILWPGDYASVDPEQIGFDAEIEIALIYGTGAVVQGGDSGSFLSGESVFASATISRAIVGAAEDPNIAAIILRIDSPGGSALASEIIWRAISRAKEAGKPVIVSMSDCRSFRRLLRCIRRGCDCGRSGDADRINWSVRHPACIRRAIR